MNDTRCFARIPCGSKFTLHAVGATAVLALLVPLHAQQTSGDQVAVQSQIRTLADEVSRVQAQLEQSQRELAILRRQLDSLRTAAGLSSPNESDPTAAASDLAAAVAEMRETQTIQAAQIATLDQSKVESASKYPVKLSGMIVVNSFVNTRRVDQAATPSVVLSGSGSTGLSFRQTIFGIDVNGPQFIGAQTHADLRLDMSASASGSGYSGSHTVGLVRLRTAHVDLAWTRTHAFFALDHPLIAPKAPASLTAIAVPALAWSGNLWAWSPQLGASYDAFTGKAGTFHLQAALIDTADPPQLYSTTPNGTYTSPSTAELSRWPGVEAHLAFDSPRENDGLSIGIGGHFARHRTVSGYYSFSSWAGALDFRIPASTRMQFSGSAYWGSALGNLGGGAYKDYVARIVDGEFYYQALDDRGGWIQWKQKAGDHVEFNEAFGADIVPAGQLRPYATSVTVSEYNLARNRTVTGNIIYSPSAYLLFSLEYRRIMSSYVTAPTSVSDIIGLGAGYRF